MVISNKQNYGIFNEVAFINEAFFDIAFSVGLFAVLALIDMRQRKKDIEKREKEQLEKQKEECKQKIKKTKDYIKACNDKYSIQLVPTDKKFVSEKDVYNDMITNGNRWLNSIKNSKAFKDYCQELISNKEEMEHLFSDYVKPPTASVSYFKSILKLHEGINGYKESIEVINGSQMERIYFGWVCDELSKMYEIVYPDNVGSVGCGDGDEGHLYYEISI